MTNSEEISDMDISRIVIANIAKNGLTSLSMLSRIPKIRRIKERTKRVLDDMVDNGKIIIIPGCSGGELRERFGKNPSENMKSDFILYGFKPQIIEKVTRYIGQKIGIY